MHNHRYVPAFKLLQFGPAWEYHMVSEGHKRRSHWRNVLRFFLTIDQVIMDDPYATEDIDYLILGDDPLLAAFAALYLARQNKSVLIHRTQQENLTHDYLEVFQSRASMFNPFFQARLDLKSDEQAMSLDQLLALICEEISAIRFDTHRPGALISDPTVRLQCYGTGKPGTETIWAEYTPSTGAPEHWQTMLNGLPRLSFHGDKGTKRYNSNPKCRLSIKNVILTTKFSSQFTSSYQCPLTLMGEAARPLAEFEQFTIRDRIFDVLETEMLKIERNGLTTD